MRTVLPVVMMLAMAIGLLGQATAPHPQPRIPTNNATPTTGEGTDLGCEGIPDYAEELNQAINDSGKFQQALTSNTDDLRALTPAEGKAIVRDGDKLLTTIEQLDVPAVYADGNKGIVGFITFLNEMVTFSSIDSSTVPHVNNYDEALQLIYDGETNAANQCPKQIKAVGGYIFIDPAQINDEATPED